MKKFFSNISGGVEPVNPHLKYGPVKPPPYTVKARHSGGPLFRGSGRVRNRVRLGIGLELELGLGLGIDEPQCIILRYGGPPEWRTQITVYRGRGRIWMAPRLVPTYHTQKCRCKIVFATEF